MHSVEQAENLIRQGDYDQAIAALKVVLAEEPDNLHALLTIGIAYTESNHNEEALKALRFYIARDSESDLAWEAVGCAHLRMGNNGPAQEALERAHRINPSNAGVLRNLSILMSRIGQQEKAYSLLKQSYNLNNDDYLTAYARACAYRQLKNPEKALSLFQTLRNRDELPEELREDSVMQYIELQLGWV